MGSFVNHDLIAEKLEMARTLGLVTDYVIGAIGSLRRPDASVKVWRNPNATDEAIKEHLARLLQGLVGEDQIVIAPQLATGETDITPHDQPSDGTASVPVAA